MIDPLDGTVNYLYELDDFAVSVAVEDASGGVAGVVHGPMNGRIYPAVRGHGAVVDGRPLRVNDPVPMERALMATGFGYSTERQREQGAMIAALLPKIATSAGSARPRWTV